MPQDYRDQIAALATCHGKQAAIAPAFATHLGLQLHVPSGINTDALGTFTGEVPRQLSMLETARAKARLGMKASGLKLGIASEGSFGPDRLLGIVAAAEELLIFIDDLRGVEITERLVSHRTNFASLDLGPQADVEGFLTRAGFPSHGLLVRGDGFLEKGITDRGVLDRAIARARGAVRLETDMRAHMNPTRMAEISRLAERLAQRLATPCPACSAPGYGVQSQTPGLACRDCGAPTSLLKSVTKTCPACGHGESHPREDGLTQADPQYCPECNP